MSPLAPRDRCMLAIAADASPRPATAPLPWMWSGAAEMAQCRRLARRGPPLPNRAIAVAPWRTGRSECEEAAATRAHGPGQTPATHSPGLHSNLHPEDYASSINFNKGLDFVGFCDLSRTSPTGFRTQTLLTGFGLTCHARRVRAHWRAPLASIGFVRITWRRATGNHARSCVARGWHRSKTLARSQEARRRLSSQTLCPRRAERAVPDEKP